MKTYKMIYGSIWAHMAHTGPYGWPEVKKNNVEKVKIIISDSDLFLGLCRGDPQDHVVALQPHNVAAVGHLVLQPHHLEVR